MIDLSPEEMALVVAVRHLPVHASLSVEKLPNKERGSILRVTEERSYFLSALSPVDTSHQ